MPRLNARGNVLMGVAGGVASIDGVRISETFGASSCWRDDHAVVFRGTVNGVAGVVSMLTNGGRAITPRPATGLAAGGGRWLAQQDGVGLFGAFELPGYNLGNMGDDERGSAGPDGTFAIMPWGGVGLELRGPDGSRDVLTRIIAREPQVVGPNQAVWRDDAGRIGVLNLPQPAQLLPAAKVRWVEIPGQPAVIVYFCSLLGIVAHPIDSLFGWQLTFPGQDAFFHDAAFINGALKVVWSAHSGEAIGDLVTVDNVFALGAPIDLARLIGDIPHPPPIVVPPPPVPPQEPPPMACDRIPAAGEAAMRALAARPEINAQIRSGNDDDRRAATMVMAEQLRFTLGPEWGTKRADGGRPPSKDSVSRVVGDRLCNYDYVNGSTRELMFGAGEDITGQVFMAVSPVNHLEPLPGPAPDPQPQPPADTVTKKQLDDAIIQVRAGIMADIARLLTDLPTPEPAPLPADVVRESTHKGRVGPIRILGINAGTFDVTLVRK